MKFRFKKVGFVFIQKVIVIFLVFSLGVILGAKYRVEEFIPFFDLENKKINFSLVNASQPSEYKDVNFAQFWEVWSILEKDYLDNKKLNPQKMVQGAIGGMTSALGDPYTMYLPPADDKRAAESLAGSFYGVGIELGYIKNTIAVVAPLKGMPAETAGVKAGDLILHVKDESKNLDEDTTGWTLNDAVDKIRGKKGSKVLLTLFRPDENNQSFDLEVKRDEIVIPSVELSFIERDGKQVAHLVLSRFGDRTKDEWDEAVEKILQKQKELAGILLDLRNNPGGYFEGSIDVASDFIDNDVVVSQEGKYFSQDYRSEGEARLKNLPLLVLVNRGSASASEIVAGALRDDLGAKLIGENTFGKGTVQDRRELADGGGLHVTVAKWILPKGSWIHETGIKPDIEVKDDAATEADEVIERAMQEL